MSKKPSVKDDVEGWMASGGADRLADYANRGRKHQHLADDELTAGWISAFRNMADDIRDYERRAKEEDLKSEILLRKREPPYDLVREEFERFIAETDRAIEDLKSEDPLRFEEIGREIDRELKTFKSTRDRTKS
jgi:hypothetical protein